MRGEEGLRWCLWEGNTAVPGAASSPRVHTPLEHCFTPGTRTQLSLPLHIHLSALPGHGTGSSTASAQGHHRRGVTPWQCQRRRARQYHRSHGTIRPSARDTPRHSSNTGLVSLALQRRQLIPSEKSEKFKMLIKHSNANYQCYTCADTQLLTHILQPCGLQTEVRGPVLI